MSITAQLHDGRTLEFPDGTDPSVVQATVKKMLAQTPQQPDEGFATKVVAGAVEPNLQLLSGMFAQPLAGLAGIAGTLLPGAEGQGADWVHKVQSALTYQPRTQAGKDASAAVGYIPEKIGEVADYAGQKVSDVAGPGRGAIINTLINLAPAALGFRGGRGFGSSLESSSVLGNTSRGLMRSALKPPKDAVLRGDADRAITTLLDEGVNVSKGGAEKLRGNISDLNDQIDSAISGSNARVDKYDVANRLQDLMQQRELQANPNADVAAITRAYDEFTQNHPRIPGRDMPVQLAQDIKKGTYRTLDNKYKGEQETASVDAQKAIARGLKEEVASAVPEVAPLNEREGQLINAKDLVDSRLATAGNRNPLGITQLATEPANFIAGLLDRSEIAKSLLARMLNPGNTSLPDAAVAGATMAPTFSEDAQKRQAIINALMGAR